MRLRFKEKTFVIYNLNGPQFCVSSKINKMAIKILW